MRAVTMLASAAAESAQQVVQTAPEPSSLADLRVLYVQYTNPAAYPPIQHSAAILAGAGCHVRLLGVAIADLPLTMAVHERVSLELMPAARRGWRQKVHYATFTARAVATARRWRPDVIYASDPLSCPAALAAMRACRARLVYHEHDSPAFPAKEATVFMRAVLRARRSAAACAAVSVLPNENRAHAFGLLFPRARTMTVWNCPSRAEIPERTRSHERSMRVLYHGSIAPAHLPLAVIDALAMLPDEVSLVVVGYTTIGHPSYVETLRRRAQERGVGDRVHFVGPVSRPHLLRHAAGCDVGLALMPLNAGHINEREMAGASNKPFDYMAAGLALVVSDLPSWRSMFVDGGYALGCSPESPESIRSALMTLFLNPETRRRMGDLGRRRIADDWNYESMFAPVLARVGAACSR